MITADHKAATRLPAAGDPRVLYVIDISGYVFRAYHALPPLQSPQGEPTHAVLGVTTMLLKLVADQKPAMLAVAMDSRGKSVRHEIFADYKATRPAPPPDLSQQIARLREIIDAYAIPVLQQDGVEADDMIAALVKRARAQNLAVVIVSADKDLLQLVGDDVQMYDTGRNIVYGPEETRQKLGVRPDQVRDYLALVGDTSDNIPGVPSIGPKTAQGLLEQFGDLDGVYAGLDQISKKGVREKLAQHREQAYLSQRLVTLDESMAVQLDPLALAWSAHDSERLRGLFLELGFTRLLRDALPSALPLPFDQPLAPIADAQPAMPALEARLIDDEAGLEAVARDFAGSERAWVVPVADEPHSVRANLVGMILAWDDAPPVYIPVGHSYLGHPPQLEAARVIERLRPGLTAAQPRKLCIDAKRARTVLMRCGVELAAVTFDPMLASYLIDAERHGHSLRELAAEFGERDLLPAQVLLLGTLPGANGAKVAELPVEHAVKLTRDIAHVARRVHEPLLQRLRELNCERLLDELELPLARVLSDMELLGIVVDAQYLVRLSGRVAEDLNALEAKCRSLAGREFNVGSPRQLEAILFDQLGLPVIKRTKTARSTDADVLEELALRHELPAAILEHRMLAKLKNTYLDALPREIDPRSGRVHTDFRQTVAATGRLSSSDPNLQNIPIRTEIGRLIRNAFIAHEGWEIMSVDYSQIELRVLAHLSHDRELVEAFTTGEDVHVRTARAIFAIPPGVEVTREQRAQSKTVNFAVIYGQTQFALARNLRIERSEAARYIKAFFEQYAGVQRYMDEVVEAARYSGGTRTLLGRVRKLPDLHQRNRQLREAAERVARNTPIQGSAADIIKLAMINIARGIAEQGLASRMLLTVHDELVFEAPPEERAALEALVVERMEHALELDVPLIVDRGWGKSWGAAH
jgi:DNA polymerase-1